MSMENRVNRLESMASKRCSKDATQMTDEELEQIIREGHDIEGPITDDVLLKIKGGEIPPKKAEGEQKTDEAES